MYPVGSFVRLSSGDHGVVMELNDKDPLNPMVRVAYNDVMNSIPRTTEDLAGDDDLRITDVINPDEHGVDVFMLLQ